MTDRVGRDVDIRVFDGDPDALVTMYEKMDSYRRVGFEKVSEGDEYHMERAL